MSLDYFCQHYALLTFISITMGICIMGFIIGGIIERKDK